MPAPTLKSILPLVLQLAWCQVRHGARLSEWPSDLEDKIPPPLNIFWVSKADDTSVTISIIIKSQDSNEINVIYKIGEEAKKCSRDLQISISHMIAGEEYSQILCTVTSLNENTTFKVIACLIKGKDFSRCHTNTSHSSHEISASTCPAKVSPVDDLMVHTVGEGWVALSWRPPKLLCLAQLEYQFSCKLADGKEVDYKYERVTDCVSWPGRHCLVIEDLARYDKYTFEVWTKLRGKPNKNNGARIQFDTAGKMAPGPPEALECVRQCPTALEVQWRCPLRPGGRLHLVNIEVVAAKETIRRENQTASLKAKYSQKIENLEPDTVYTVYVWFTTTSNEVGERGNITLKTSRSPTATSVAATATSVAATATSVAATMTSAAVTVTSCEPLATVARERRGVDSFPWVWIAVCSCLTVAVFIALFAGHRYGKQAQWKHKRMKETRSNSANSGHFGNSLEPKMAGTKALRAAGGGGGERTEPKAAARVPVLDYAEIDLSTGVAWVGSQQRLPGARAAATEYEELACNPGYAQPYAREGDSAEGCKAPPHLYAELSQPKPLAPPPHAPAPAPASTVVPVYAQVDKEKKRAARPPPPPPDAAPRLE